MNGGTNYQKAKALAQTSADRDRQPRYLYQWNRVWWIEREETTGQGVEVITPSGPTQTAAEQALALIMEIHDHGLETAWHPLIFGTTYFSPDDSTTLSTLIMRIVDLYREESHKR